MTKKTWQSIDDFNRLTDEGSRMVWLKHLALSIFAQVGAAPPNDRERNAEAVRLAETWKGDEQIGADFPTWLDDHYRDMLIDMVGQACIGELRL